VTPADDFARTDCASSTPTKVFVGLRCTDAIEVPLFSAVNNREYLNESPVINDMPTKEMRKMISTLGPFRFFIQPVLEMVDAVMSARYQYGSTAGGIE
jgi:hypothetical protein